MGHDWPRISIVTPSFNQNRFLEETIRSVLEQGYPNLEYVIVDGGSTDGSVDTIRKYASQLAYWVSEQDGGQSEAINKGFAQCTGEIITFCNSDDVYLPGTLQDVAEAFCANPECGAIVGGFYYIDGNSQRTSGVRPPRLDKTAPVDLTLGPPGVYRLHQAATFFTRHTLDAVGRYVREDLKYTMDRELLYRVCRHYPIVLREQPYAAFRLHGESKSVGHILPFAREFAQLYLMYLSGDREADRRRRQMARRHRAKGHLKYARAADGKLKGVLSLLSALYFRPGLLMNKGYYANWLQLFGLR
jgi:glycosyltransferase involved in cell wall biosynthesis